ncbi:MAG: pectinesterase family protein [Verrucomicrobiota bacterium]
MNHHHSETARPIPRYTPHRLVILCQLALLALFGLSAQAATIIWSGASGTDTNWSTAGNWNGGVPTSADDVKFFDTGTNGVAGTPNNLVDGAFVGPIGSLQFGNTNGFHTTVIAPGQTLTVNGGLSVFTPADPGVAKTLNETITGLEGTLTLNNTSSNLVLNQGNSAANGSRSILDLSGLGNFNANISRLGIGTTVLPNPSGNQRMAGTLSLARTNVITLNYTDTLANYQLAGRTNALEMVRHPGNNSGVMSFLYLGITNTVFVASMGFGRAKASAGSAAWMGFNPAFTNLNPTVYIRGASGGSSRVTWWSLGDMNASASSAQVSVGTNDFTGGTVDAMVDVLSLGRDCSPNHTATANIIGVLTFSAGTIDANTIYAGNQSLGPTTSLAPNIGILNVNGAATLRVNSNLVLGRTVNASGTAATRTSGTLNIRNGTVLAHSISAGTTSTNNVITLTNGTLVVTNTAGTIAKAITTITTTNSTLQLSVTGANSPNVVVTNLVTGGTTNIISVPTVAVFASYPTQFTLVKYTGSIGGAGYNFGLGAISGAAPGAYLSNNTGNASIDLVLPTDPKPAITSLPNSYGGSPGDNVTFTAGYSGSEPITLQWLKNGTNVLDGETGSGATNSGASTASLLIENAQETDSGAYALVASNPYGSVTSTPPASLIISTADIAPIINGPNPLTVVQGNNATFTTSVSGKPVPTVQWYKNGAELTGETSANLTILNAQYPADQATYSIVASNSAGLTTNSANLTVIVAPVIAVPPADLVVTNTQAAAFTVVSTNGVPAVTYQWKKNGNNIANATNATLSFPSATPADIGTYSVLIANAAGSVLSSGATLIVNSTMTANTLTPANAATGVFYDTPLTITFSVAPTLRTAGTIKIYNATNTVTPVDTIDLSLGNAQQRLFPGDGQSFTYNVVNISGNTAKIFPHFNVMTSNQTYYVIVDNGAFTDSAGAYFSGITDTNAWRFTTKPTGPASPTSIVVAANGSGDFLTVQGAVNSITSGNTTPTLINIRTGDYNEIVNISGKHNLTFRGESRTGVVVGATNNATFQAANGGTTHARMAFKVNANDIAVDNLTITNRTPQGGSQAEALMMSSGARRFIANNTTIASRQDTILANENSSQGYFNNSKVIGNFDYVWGGGNLFFTNCNIHNISGTGSGNVTAARTAFGASAATGNWMTPDGLRWSSNGFSFVSCEMTADAGVVNITLAGNNGTAGGLSSWINCRFATNAYIAPGAGLASSYNFWQYQNTELTGVAPVTYANVVTLTGGDPRLLAAQDATIWLNGWTPQLAPNILSNPANQSVFVGETATFSVNATGVENPTYQWLQNSTNAPYATANSATLIITNAQTADAGTYSVIVSNSAGTATSTTATLTVTALVQPALSNFTVLGDGNFQFNATGGSGQPYRVWASTNVALTPITSTWTLLSSGTFGGSPLIFTDTQATNYPQRFYLLTVP